MRRSFKKTLLVVSVVAWLGVASWGMKGLVDYSFQPGESGPAGERWPADSALARARDRFTFVLALHPECPCSRATVAQLERIMAQSKGRVDVVALFDQRSAEAPMEASAFFARLRTHGGVRLVNDRAGAELERFGFRTSGETRLYGPDGALVFQGGITASRGHEGDNPGQTAVLAALRGDARGQSPVRMPVFGCSLRCE